MSKRDDQQDPEDCACLSMDKNQEIIDVNEAFTRVFGYYIKGLKGTKLESLLSRSSRTLFQIYFLPLIKMNRSIEEMHLSFKTDYGYEIPMIVHIETNERDGQLMYDLVLYPFAAENNEKGS